MELFTIPGVGRDSPLITAHAGCQGTEPNSRESIIAAYHSPADIVEVDVRASREGVVFLMHDEALAPSGGESVRLENLSWNEIQQTALSGQQSEILSLEAFCDLVEQLEHGDSQRASTRRPLFNLDIKDPSALPATATTVRSRRLQHRVIFSGLDERGIALAALCIPDLSYFFNADSFLPNQNQTKIEEGRIEDACSLALLYGCRGINLEWTRASATLVRSIHERGLSIMLWTVDEEADMRRVLEYRPDSITTHHPERLASILDEHRRN
jgi:glycerophosphoryl diester phosphodiesterase